MGKAHISYQLHHCCTRTSTGRLSFSTPPPHFSFVFFYIITIFYIILLIIIITVSSESYKPEKADWPPSWWGKERHFSEGSPKSCTHAGVMLAEYLTIACEWPRAAHYSFIFFSMANLQGFLSIFYMLPI